MKSDPFTNNIESLFEPTDQEIVLYNHLDTLFPRSDQKFIEYKKYMPEDYFGTLMTGAIKMDIFFMSIQN